MIIIGEYLSQQFLDHLSECGIVSQRTPYYAPQHNGGYALETVAPILNMVPTKKVDKTLPNCFICEFWDVINKILVEVQDTPTERQTEEPSSSFIILRDSELVKEKVVRTNVVEQALHENKKNDVARVAPILYRSRKPSNLLDR
ncbi:hypothetical protein Tco_1059009 [Tanacetum coccineum]